MDRIIKIRQLKRHHHFTLMLKDLSHVGEYAKLNNSGFRLLKKILPGAYTFILEGTKDIPNRLLNGNRKTIGVRVSSNANCAINIGGFDGANDECFINYEGL